MLPVLQIGLPHAALCSDPNVQSWACSRWTHCTNSTSSLQEQEVSALPRLMQAPVQTRSLASACDLFCCLPWRCSQNKDLSVMMCGRTWTGMMKDSVQKIWAADPYKSYPYTAHFKRYASAVDFREHTCIYVCPSASQTLLSTAHWLEMQVYKCFRNMTLHF